jgi:phospholipase/carboxylesterase
LLHGTGGDEHDLLPLRDHLSPGPALLSVRGTVLENGMPRFSRRLRDGVLDKDDLRQRAGEPADLVVSASGSYDIEPAWPVAVGFSNGANIAAALLLARPGLLVPYAEPPDTDLSAAVVIISNGDRDPMIPATMTQQPRQAAAGKRG